MQCVLIKKLIKWTSDVDDTKKSTQYSQIVWATENLKMRQGGPSYRQASGTKSEIKALR